MKTVRVVAYAINGRGLGHLVRQLAILRWARRLAPVLGARCEAWVLTSSEGDTLARREGVPAIKLPSKAMLRDAGIEPARYLAIARSWVVNAIGGLAPDVLVVDTFPGGSFGELVAALELAPKRVLVARAVKDEIAGDDGYRALLPLYDATIVPDERGVGPILLRERSELLSRDEARTALGVPPGARAVYVTLGGGGDEVAPHALPWLVDALVPRGWHVVVGAGPLYTGPERRGAGITWIDRYVPLELLHGVDAAVSAGGYNSVTELMFAGVPTVFLPQPRLADDQAARAHAAAERGAGRIARRLEDVPDLLDDPGTRAAALAMVSHNGARAAAIEVLAQVLPRADVEHAASLFTPEVLAAIGRAGGRADRRLHDLLAALGGPAPAEAARRAELLAELADEGAVISVRPEPPAPPAAARIERFLHAAEAAGAPWDEASTIALGLRRVFPAASPAELVDTCATLFDSLARFRDWMGVVSLVRALPIQRGYPPAKFVSDLRRWLDRQDDLFDALRALTHLEGAGKRPLPDVLHALAEGP